MKAGQLIQGQTRDRDDKTRYTDDDITALTGFSHNVQQGDQLRPILAAFNNAKQKNIDVFRHQIVAQMKA